MKHWLVFIALATTILSASRGAPAELLGETHWFLNSRGQDSAYGISEFFDSGLPVRLPRVVTVRDAPKGTRHVAWPTAIRHDGGTYLFASLRRGRRWDGVGLWTRRGDGDFQFQDVVLTANEDEPNGVGPAHVAYDPAAPAPFLMYYLVRGRRGPGFRVALATSRDGRRWTRRGSVMQADAESERAGFAPSYLCRDRAGRYLLFYMAYPDEDLSKGVAMLARSDDPAGPFAIKQVIYRNDDLRVAITGGGARGTAVLRVESTTGLQVGHPYVIAKANSPTPEIVVIRQIRDRLVFLAYPLVHDQGQSTVFSPYANKVDPSFVWRDGDTWRGVFTVFGHAPGVGSEYTFVMRAPAVVGPWVPEKQPYYPYFLNALPNHRLSTENPIPLRDDLGCAIGG